MSVSAPVSVRRQTRAPVSASGRISRPVHCLARFSESRDRHNRSAPKKRYGPQARPSLPVSTSVGTEHLRMITHLPEDLFVRHVGHILTTDRIMMSRGESKKTPASGRRRTVVGCLLRLGARTSPLAGSEAVPGIRHGRRYGCHSAFETDAFALGAAAWSDDPRTGSSR